MAGQIKRVPTGIKAFDDILDGGLESSSVVLVKGGTGTGKTIFSLQYLYNGCTQYNEPGLFISFQESQESICTTGAQFGWDLEKLIKKEKLAFISYHPHEVGSIVKDGGGTLKDLVDSIGAKRIVVDSLTSYSLFFENTYQTDIGVLELMYMIKSWNCTALVTAEENVDVHRSEGGRLGFLSDGVIHFYHLRKDVGKFRALEVIKMRHTTHSDDMLLFAIKKNGIEIKHEGGIFEK